MKKFFILFIALGLSSGYVFAQNTASTVTFVNTGKMFIGGDAARPALYVPDAVRMLDNNSNVPEIFLDKGAGSGGRWDIGGNFYQDSEGNVFKLSTDGYCYGMVRFVANRGVKRYIVPSWISNPSSNTQAPWASFDRSLSYVAFPSVILATNDTVTVPALMGIDVSDTHIGTDNVYSGKLLLESREVGGKVYDASLRVRFPDSKGVLADLGMVIVEKWVDTYRNGEQMFGFATPFLKTQLSGYFAGNWVRMPKKDENMHTEYILGNKPKYSGSSVIHADQYVQNPEEKLVAGQAYLIKPRPAGFNYQTLADEDGLMITGVDDPIPSAYDKEKFVFNGDVYKLTPYLEQLFTSDNLPAHHLSGVATTGNVNWLIGNSYTCAISLEALSAYMLDHPTLYFASTIYVFPAGSQTYQPYNFAQTIALYEMEEIPAMSIFVLRPSGGQTTTEDFKIDKSMLVHSTVDYGQTDYHPIPAPGKRNAPKSKLENQVIFSLTTADNQNNFDLAAIGLRAQGTLGLDKYYDNEKVYIGENAGFQLYTMSAADANTGVATKLAINCVPLDVDSVIMNVRPMAHDDAKEMVLSVKGRETLSSEDFWIEDLLTGKTHNFINNEPYFFTTNKDDAQERFVVHFNKAPEVMDDLDEVSGSKLNMYAVGKEIFIENLLPNDMGADAAIYDIAGKLLDTFKVTNTPTMNYLTNGLVNGTYIMRLYRQNSAETLKLIIR